MRQIGLLSVLAAAVVAAAGCDGGTSGTGGNGGSGNSGGGGNGGNTGGTGGNTGGTGGFIGGNGGTGGTVACVSPLDCDDGDVCTLDDCEAGGTCSNTAIDPDDGDACTTDSCDPILGPVNTPVDPDDGNACTLDSCDPILGVDNFPIDPDDGDACTTDSCDPILGPVNTPVDPDDADACTFDSCDSILGVSNDPINIDDGNACTADTCNALTGEAHTAVPTDDMNACTTDACDMATGVSHTPISPSDMNLCTFDSCDPATGPVFTGETVLFTEDFSSNAQGWTLGTEWAIGPAVLSAPNDSQGGHDPAQDHTPTADNGVAGAVIGGNISTAAPHGAYYLTSPAINLTSAPAGAFLELRLWRWLSTDYPGFINSTIEVSPDGVVWTPVFAKTPAPTVDTGWFPMSFDVTAFESATFHVRVGYDVNAGAFSSAGWSIDDVSIVSTPVSTDGDQCTQLACDPLAGAQFSPLATDDGNACTVDSCSGEFGIQHVPVNVNDNNGCTVDACDPATGAITHTPVNVDDGNACTADACNPLNGAITHVAKTAIFAETFANNNAGWTLGPTWAIGATVASACGSDGQDPALDHTPSGDNGVAGVGLGTCIGPAQLNAPSVCLTSPIINTSVEPGSVSLKFWRHLHSDYTPYMINTVDVFNGVAFVNKFTTGGAATNDANWLGVTIDVTAEKNANFRVRYCYDVTDPGAFNEASWSVDDVTVYNPVCVNPL